MNFQDNFITNLTSAISAGATTAPLNAIPSVDAPFPLALDATNANGHFEIIYPTSKTSTNVNFAACTYAHTTDEEIRMVLPANEIGDFSSLVNNLGDGSSVLGMSRQAIMNGNFDVWQRGTSVALADVTPQFQADRWLDYIDKNGGTLPTLTRSQQLLTSGDIANAFYFTRLATNGAGTSLGVSSRGELTHKIEHGVRNLCGNSKKVTVSFWARSSIANKRICPILRQAYGSGGSPTSEELILGTPITLTSSWVKYTATFTTNTLIGKTFGTDNNDNLTVVLAYMWGTTWGNTNIQASVTAETFVGSGNIDIAQVQLCAGEVALPFQPKGFLEELTACLRYYEKSYNYGIIPGTASVIGCYKDHIKDSYLNYHGNIEFKVIKRVVPTMTWYSTNNANTTGVCTEYNAGSSYVADRAITEVVGESGVSIGRNNVGTGGNQIYVHWTASAEL